MNVNDHPTVALTLTPEGKCLRSGPKETWRRTVEKERVGFGLKADGMLGFVQRTEKHGKIERCGKEHNDDSSSVHYLTSYSI